VHKHLITLRGLGIVMQSARSDRYRLGWKLVELGLAAEAQSSIVSLAEAHMRRLRDESQLTVFLEQPSGGQLVVSHAVPSESGIAVTIRKGMELPLHGSAGGRVMLAFSSEELQERVLTGELRRLSERMMSNPSDIRSRLKTVRANMYDSTAGESPTGIHALAAPVLDQQGGFVASVGVIGTAVQILQPPAPGQVRLVQQCAASISSAMGSDAYDALGITPWA
jgi:DNA-binding IclR family transcriptional regulator